ncbi:MAG: kelch repeat-containing protein [Bacteroidia bacterium]
MNYKIFIACLLLSTISKAQPWTQVADFTGTERDDATAFVIGNTAYCITGYQVGWSPTANGAAFNGSTETWLPMQALPAGKERQYATSFAHNNYGYVLGGVGNTVLNDFWQYNPTTNAWLQLPNFPDSAIQGMSSFILNNKVYVVGGKRASNHITNAVWEYDFSTSTWTQKNNMPNNGMWRGAAFSIDSTAYICFGINNNNAYNTAMYSYTSTNDTWHKINTAPLPPRKYVSTVVINGKALLYGGQDSLNIFSNDLLSYNPTDSSFATHAGIPTIARKGAVAFALNNILYLSTGINTNYVRLKETWKNTQFVGIATKTENNTLRLYPNPATHTLHIYAPHPTPLTVYNMLGELVQSTTTNGYNATLDITTLPTGIYIIKTSGQVAKFIKE